MSEQPATKTATEGSIDATRIPRLFAEAWRDRRSGWLSLSRGSLERRVQFLDGSPLSVESTPQETGFARNLEESGQITGAERFKVEQFARERDCPEASAVLALRLLDARQLYKAIRKQTRRSLGETFEWQTGTFAWQDEPVPDARSGKPLDGLKLLQEQLPLRWGSERLFAALLPESDLRADIPPRYRRIAASLGEAGELARRAIDRLDGTVSLGQILGECAGDPLAAGTLWVLLHAGILRERATTSARAETTPFDFEVEIEVAEGASSTTAGGTARQEARETAGVAKSDARSEALRAEIGSLIERLDGIDHYEALGLEQDAGTADIKKAYFKAAKKYHPDALARMGLEALREDAARVFARIAEAFETLSDPDKRAAYDAGGGDEPEIDTARLAQAETSFRKGEILLRMGNFEGALEYLEPAVDLWPDEPAYQSGLGWALYKQPQSDVARALEHLELAARAAPDDAVILFRLGMVLRASGEQERASELIERARALEPSIDD